MPTKTTLNEQWIKASIIGSMWASIEIVWGSFFAQSQSATQRTHPDRHRIDHSYIGKLPVERKGFVLACRHYLFLAENNVAKCGDFWADDCHLV